MIIIKPIGFIIMNTISQFYVLVANQLSNDQSIKTSATLLNKYGSVIALGYNVWHG